MSSPWYAAKPELRSEIERHLADTQPGLRVRLDDTGRLLATGSYGIPGVDSSHARYAIQILFPQDYPEDVPTVREIGGRITPSPERHVNHDGTACLMVPEAWLALSEDTSFSAFMAGPVRNFFIGQSLVELGQPWPHGERSHGKAGVREAFSELFGVNEEPAMHRYLAYLQRTIIKGHWSCPCGSGEPLRRCHLEQLRRLQIKISPKLATRMSLRLSL